jgi:hypothetical protein
MSYYSYIGGEYIETTGGDSKIFSRENIEYNSVGVITSTSNEGHSFGKPTAMPPMEINNMYVKVRIKEPYNGEFGFDWIDVSPDDKKDIQKIQDVDFANVEYFYKEGATENDLGDIVEKSSDENGAKNAIIKHYKFNNICKYVDMPFVLIKPLQEITLTAEIILREGEIKDDEIKITGDDFYDFEIVGGTKEGKTSIIKVAKAGKIDFKIKCLKEGSEKRYNFYHNNPTSPSLDVGGVFMMENKVLKLKFRVIALVSSDNNPNEKAKALFKKFKESKVKEYLNENSLNQAGYEVEIENYNEMDNADVDDYFYAFDKEDWKTKGLFKENHVKKVKKTLISWTNDGKPIKTETENDIVVDVIAYEGDIDGKTIEAYVKKISTKNKSYTGCFIILADYEAKPDHVGAFSQGFPFDHNILFVYSSNNTKIKTYSHEIGHMLGLEHTFITINSSINTDDTKGYLDKKTEINKYNQENIVPVKLIIENEKSVNRGKPLGKQSKSVTTFKKGYNGIREKTLLTCINNSNSYFDARIRDYNLQINAVNNNTNYIMPMKDADDKWILNPDKTLKQFPTTPAFFKERLRVQKRDFEGYKENNINSKSKILNTINERYINFSNEFDLIPEDKLKIYEDYLKKLMQEWKQMISNYLYFKQNTTKNIMDYTPPEYDVKTNENIEQSIRFMNHQILIMRKDYENY